MLKTEYLFVLALIDLRSFSTRQVCSIVQVVGIVLCLHGATKISHRALGLSSVCSRWHALVTCNSNGAPQMGIVNNVGNVEASQGQSLLPINYSESDLESIDDVPVPINTQLSSYMSTYQKRQAFGMYFQLPKLFSYLNFVFCFCFCPP